MVKRRTRRKRAMKRKTQRKTQRKSRVKQQRGGFSFESISKDNELDTVVTAFPDPQEPEQAPMTARLPLIRRVLADTAV
jgi:hypothetical protein